MIDLAVQTLWTKPQSLNTEIRKGEYFGFETMNNFLASAYLSFIELKKKGYRVHLHTDKYGKELLVNKLKLNYDYVDLSHEDLDLNPNAWAFAKVYTHLKQTEPFVHVDLDAFLFKDFTPEFKSQDIIFQNIESNFEHYKFLWSRTNSVIQNYNTPVYMKMKEIMHNERDYAAMNVGIFGGNDLKTIRHFCKEAIKFLNDNIEYIRSEHQFYFCIIVEQMYLYYYCQYNGIKATPLYEDKNMQVEDFNDWDNYVHLISSVKLDPERINKLLALAEKEGYDS